MEKSVIIKNISIVVIILTAVFLSQQPYFKKTSKDLYNKAVTQIGPYWSNAENWAKSNIYPKIGDVYSKASSEAQDRGEGIKNELTLQKEKVSENFGEKIKNYFSGIVDSVFNPSKNASQNASQQNCPQSCPAAK
ncbi:MAG: hypothetical protein AAB352_00325 [Patescibacteria group bacterium]